MNFIQACQNVISLPKNQQNETSYLIKEKDQTWSTLFSNHPKNSDLYKSLNAILKQVKDENTYNDDQKQIITLAAKKIKKQYDTLYLTKRNIFQVIELFLTGSSEKLKVHRAYKEIKISLNLTETSTTIQSLRTKIQTDVNVLKGQSLFNFLWLPLLEKKTLVKILLKKVSLEEAKKLSPQGQDLLRFFAIKYLPIKTLNLNRSSYSIIQEKIKASKIDKESFRSFSNDIKRYAIENKMHYTLYKEIYRNSHTPKLLESFKLLFRRRTEWDQVQSLYQKNRQILDEIQKSLLKNRSLKTKARHVVENASSGQVKLKGSGETKLERPGLLRFIYRKSAKINFRHMKQQSNDRL